MPSDDVARRVAALAVTWHAAQQASHSAIPQDGDEREAYEAWSALIDLADAARDELFIAVTALPPEVRANIRRG